MKSNLTIILPLIMAITLLFGCTTTINPMDLAPSKNYTINTDTNSGAILQNNQTKIMLTTGEIAKHNRAGDCWMIINNNVYDLSNYVNHPGGYTYAPYCGNDGTTGYNTKGGRRGGHSTYADSLLATYLVGALGQTVTTTQNTTQQSNSNSTQNQIPTGINQENEWDD